MANVTTITRHAFLSPGHSSWSVWTADGSRAFTNPGNSHRVLESLAYALDQMVTEGWQLQQIFTDQGAPTLVVLSREETTSV